MTELNGPFIMPMGSAKAEKLVVFLHGFGADGYDLISLSSEFAKIFPKAVFLSPNAPFANEDFPMGYQWFSLRDRKDEALYEGLCKALPILRKYIDENLAKYNLTYEDLILIGFSQGTMMALQLALNLPEKCFAVIGFSGILVGASFLDKDKISRPPIFLSHGDQDQVLPLSLHQNMVRNLNELDVPLVGVIIKGDGHTISAQTLECAKEFLVDLAK